MPATTRQEPMITWIQPLPPIRAAGTSQARRKARRTPDHRLATITSRLPRSAAEDIVFFRRAIVTQKPAHARKVNQNRITGSGWCAGSKCVIAHLAGYRREGYVYGK